jgi:hypothetical protein
MVLPQGIGHPLVGRHRHLAHLRVSGIDWRGARGPHHRHEDLPLYDDDGARDGTWNLVVKKEAQRNLTTYSRR